MKELPCFLVNENRLRKEPLHARCYCAAIAAAAATVVGAGVSAYSTMSADDPAAAGAPAGGGGAGATDLYGKKIKPVDYKNTVNLPTYDAMKGSGDYLAMLPELSKIAHSVTLHSALNREEAMPGIGQVGKNAVGNLIAMSRGQVSKDVVDVTNQIVAEKTGGGLNAHSPDSYAGGGSQAATEFARNIGRSSQQNVNDFLSAAPTWEQLADKFAYSPDEAMGSAMDLLRTRNSYALGVAEIQKGIDENLYTSELNKQRTIAAPNPQAVGSRNDALMQQAYSNLSGSGGSGNPNNYLTSINGVVSGLGGVVNAYKGSTAASSQEAWNNEFVATGGAGY